MQLTTDTSAQDVFDSAYVHSKGTYIVVTNHKIAILYSQNSDTKRIYGVRAKVWGDLPLYEDEPVQDERQMKRLALMFGLPGGRVNTVINLRHTQKLMSETNTNFEEL